MNNPDLLKSLDFILNKGVCVTTIHRAWREFNKIKTHLREEDRTKIYQLMLNLDPDYPDHGLDPHGYYHCQFCNAVKNAKIHIVRD